MKRLRNGAQPLAESRQTVWLDHELLEINRRIRMRAPVDHVRHRNRQHLRIRPAKILEQRNPNRLRRRFGGGQRNRQNGVSSKLGFCFRAIQIEHDAVHRQLIERINTSQRRQDFARHILHGLRDALAAVAFRITVPQLDGFVLARARARRNRRAPNRAARQVSARIKDLARLNIIDRAHVSFLIQRNQPNWRAE